MASAITTTLRPTSSSRNLRKPAASASTPNLGLAYSSQPQHSPKSKLAPPTLSRKASFAALTPSSLASIPDVSESYALDSVLSDPSQNMAPPATPGRPAADDLVMGDTVEVPGGMHGTVRFVGQVQGKKGIFAGVELLPDFAARGKNNGDVDGVSYFTTSIPGAGIFLPVSKAVPRNFTPPSAPSFPITPAANGLKAANHMTYTPPTPGLPKFSASVGPGARAESPRGKRPSIGLARPESPVRRLMTPGPRPSLTTPGKTPSVRYGSPTNRFASSVRGAGGDPSKRTPRLDHKPSLGPRSVSAMEDAFDEDEPTPVGVHRTQTNGSIDSVSSLNLRNRSPSRAPSRAASRAASRAQGVRDDEVERLRAQLEDREQQLKEQSSTLAEMESSLVELQGLMEYADAPQPRRDSIDDKDSAQLRRLLREKNEKIALLTAEFDAHRADFRSTIDTLEMASTETERVYEKRMDELMGDIRELESRNLDVDSVAIQLKQLEELVQELEEGLEDARRGEAEARGEVEFLRGEVERTRTELQREREKTGGGNPHTNGDAAISKELEQKEDEIRGLKAIIHSLSRDSVPGEVRSPPQRPGSFIASDHVANKIARDNLERQVAEMEQILERKASREQELEQELEALRQGDVQGNSFPAPNNRSSLRDSRDTVILTRAHDAQYPEATHKRANTLDTMPESDAYSTATETSTLWCEICETNGHDILTCTNMFGPDGSKSNNTTTTTDTTFSNAETPRANGNDELKPRTPTGDDAPAPLSPFKARTPVAAPVKATPNPLESGPVAGKESGIMDPEKWCAVCERDGHDSVDCPFEDF